MSDGDPLTEICAQLTVALHELAGLTPEPGSPGRAAPGMNGRAPAAPLPGNPAAFYAYTSIHASARWAAGILHYALSAGDDVPWGGADTVTLKLLSQVIPQRAFGVDDDTYSLVITELSRRLNDGLAHPDIDRAQRWRPLGKSRSCPCCRCFQLYAAVDAKGSPTGHIECMTYGCKDPNGYRPMATLCGEGIAWAHGLTERAISEAA